MRRAVSWLGGTAVAIAFAACTTFDAAIGEPLPDAGDDVRNDVANGADAASVFRCANGAHLFCEDFEGTLDKWSLADARIRIGTSPSRSGNVLISSVDEGAKDVTSISVFLDTTAPVVVRFAFRADDPRYAADAGGSSNFFPLWLMTGMANGSFVLAPGTGGANASAGLYDVATQDYEGVPHQTVSWDEWHEAALELDLGPSARVRLSIDGKTVGETALATPEGKPSLHLGVWRPNQTTPALRVEIDDVRVDPL